MTGLLTIQTQLFSGPFADVADGIDINLLAAAGVATGAFLSFSLPRRAEPTILDR